MNTYPYPPGKDDEETATDVVDVKIFNQVAQLGHWAGGMAWGFGWMVVLQSVRGALWAMLAGIVIAGVKEFWYDQNYETEVVRGSNAEDFGFYCAGFATALVVILMAGWWWGF